MHSSTRYRSYKEELVEHRLAPSSTVSANAPVSKDSVFSDRRWNMRSHTVRNKGSEWDFQSVPGFPKGFALTLAEFAYHRMYDPTITHDREAAWPTVYNELVSLRQFANFSAQESYPDFSELDFDVIKRFISNFTYKPGSSSPTKIDRAKAIINHLQRLWEYRSKLSTPLKDTLFKHAVGDMFGESSGNQEDETSGNEEGENRTPPIPEYIFGPMTGAALDYVLEYSEMILRAYKKAEQAVSDAPGYKALSSGGASKRKAKVIKGVLKNIPSPWRKSNWTTPRELYREIHQLRRACVITMLAFSGVRNAELLSTEAGCCVAETLDDGRVRYYINTLLRKFKGNGSRDSWVVIEEVSKAVAILEELTKPQRSATGKNWLLISSGDNASYSIGRASEFRQASVYSDASLIEQINTFVHYCNHDLARPTIPQWTDDNGQSRPWKFTCRQFRRTLARYIARQPFGIIAGMLQYKHVNAACFVGYAGSEPEWNKMLAQEEVLASIDILEEVAIDLSNGAIAGEFGLEVKKAYEKEFKGRVEDYPPSQIAKWLANREKTLFVGKFNFCFFDSNKALCVKRSDKADRPILNSCDPANCKNSCVSKRHLPLWKAQLNQASELMRHPKSSPLQREIISREIASLKKVVEETRG